MGSTGVLSQERFQAEIKFTGRMCTHAGGSICSIESTKNANAEYYKIVEKDEEFFVLEIKKEKLSQETIKAIKSNFYTDEKGRKHIFYKLEENFVLPQFVRKELLLTGNLISKGSYPLLVQKETMLIKFRII